jgi:hypothetical protein
LIEDLLRVGIDAAIGETLTWLDLATPNQVAIGPGGAVNAAITFIKNAGSDIPDLSQRLKIGDIIAINDGVAEKPVRITGFATTADAGQPLAVNNTINVVALDNTNIANVGAAGLVAQVRTLQKQPQQSRRIKSFEICWQPPLGIFKVGHAMPVGNYELVLNPQNQNIYEKLAIESVYGDKDIGLGAANFSFEVDDMYLYVCEVKGPRIDNVSYYLDLEEITAQRRPIQATTGLQQEEFTVSPSTCALTLAFQDNRTGSNSLFSPSRFKIDNAASRELLLNRLYINYAGINKPQPDADPDYKSDANTVADYTTQRYNDSTMYAGTYYSAGGSESIEEWHDRGAYYFLPWNKDRSDRSTRVFTNYQFAQAINRGSVLLFNHYKKASLIRIENGIANQVIVQEM